MFNQILKLIRKNKDNTPLEDYTTELFVGTLNNDRKLKILFCKDFLQLESNDFNITTQEFYSLENSKNCIIDVVIKGDNEICFMENKVNSKEGELQLERYSKVLNGYKNDGIKTKLVYCTKNSDPKTFEQHSFIQFKWHNVSEFFKRNSNEKITNLFIDFLKQNNMSTDMTIKGVHLTTLEHANNIFNLIDKNIDNVKSVFSTKFGDIKDLRNNSQFKKQIYEHERICIMATPIDDSKGWSEILYGFEFKGNLISQIYLDIENEFHDIFVENIQKQDILKYIVFDFGSVVYTDKNLGDFLNDEDSECKIKDWFLESFDLLQEFMNKTKTVIDWK
jgi:hypothetical protein